MNEIYAILTVIGLFLLRIGLPLILLIALGTLLERHEARRRAQIKKMYKPMVTEDEVIEDDSLEIKKAA